MDGWNSKKTSAPKVERHPGSSGGKCPNKNINAGMVEGKSGGKATGEYTMHGGSGGGAPKKNVNGVTGG